jgi:hypothetical protein
MEEPLDLQSSKDEVREPKKKKIKVVKLKKRYNKDFLSNKGSDLTYSAFCDECTSKLGSE